MGSTGEPERKRRHISSISPTAAAAKKHPLAPCSEDKKLDVTVLHYKNKKLAEQLEAHKFEHLVLESKLHQLTEKQNNYDETLDVVNKSWERLIVDLESISLNASGDKCSDDEMRHFNVSNDRSSYPAKDDFLGRLLETGATESSDGVSHNQTEVDARMTQWTTRNILQNIVYSFNNIWHIDLEFGAAAFAALPDDERSRQLQKTLHDLMLETGNFLAEVDDLHLKHRSLAGELQNHHDADAKNKVEHKRLTEELASAISELEESNNKLSILKAQKDTSQGAPVIFPALGSKHVGSDKDRDLQKHLQDMEASLKELTDLVSSRLSEIRRLHEEKNQILKKLADLRNTLMDNKRISSSEPFRLLSEQLQKSGEEMNHCRSLLEKLQAERDSFAWHEKEMMLKAEIANVAQRVSTFSESRISELQQMLQKMSDEKELMGTKLVEALREPGRKEVIAHFRALVSSLPKDMGIMQSELSKNKKDAIELHSFRAEIQSLCSMLNRKGNEIESLSGKSIHHLSEIKKMQSMVRDLSQTNQELKLFLEMYRRESTDSREIIESRDREYKAWALVHSLKSSLDEHNLELRVKEANEAEATSQKRLAAAEAEIDELRHKLEASDHDISELSEVLKSKHEEGEAYLSEIENIGQAYEDLQTQNQHLLQQIVERDDYNIKLFMESVSTRLQHEELRMEIQMMKMKLQQSNLLMDLFNQKVALFDDQLKLWSDHVNKLAEDGRQASVTLENARKRLLNVHSQSHQLRQTLDGFQSTVEKGRLDVAELLTELEKERFNKKRIEEDLETMTKKLSSLTAQTKGSVLEKLKQEVKEYRGILKCSICLDRQKEVVIAKCYHLFCHQCVQKTIQNRHRKCPTCGLSFSQNDVKPIYI